jgi:hypothetical protein
MTAVLPGSGRGEFAEADDEATAVLRNRLYDYLLFVSSQEG